MFHLQTMCQIFLGFEVKSEEISDSFLAASAQLFFYALVLHKGVHLVDYLLGSTLSLTMRRICIVSGSRKTHRGGGGS